MKVNIEQVLQIPSMDPARLGKRDTVVHFGVEGRGRDFIIIPLDDPDQKAIEAAVSARVKSRHASEGSSLEV